MQDYNRNAVWCRVIVDQLIASGVTQAVVCAGNRSSALVLAMADRPELDAIPHIDERSGGFLALGMARATGRPVAITTTSGSAVVNLLPALVEAHAAGIPLIVLSCDRPVRWRGAGAPQMADHAAACAPYVRDAIDLEEPTDTPEALRALREAVARLTARAGAARDPGPVHLNVPMRGRICPTEEEEDETWAPPGDIGEAVRLPPPAWEGDVAALDGLELRPGLRGLIFVGSISPLTAAEVDTLARATGFPVLTDAPGLVRRPAVAHVVGAGDAIAWHPVLAAWPAEVVIRVGSAPITEAMMDLLQRQTCPVIRLDHRPVQRDFLHRQFVTLAPPFDHALASLAARLGPGDPTWLGWWLQAEARAQAARAALVEALPWGECQAAAVACAAPGFDLLHLANSMSVRHGDLHCAPGERDQPIYANRGVNGIDGTLGTFLGELHATGRRGLLLIGDQTVLHDLPALAAVHHLPVHGVICVNNNDGGSVFDMVACSRFPNYRTYVRNAPHISFEGVAATFGLAYTRVTDRAGLEAALAEAAVRPGLGLIEMVVPPDSMRTEIVELIRGMCGAVGLPGAD